MFQPCCSDENKNWLLPQIFRQESYELFKYTENMEERSTYN